MSFILKTIVQRLIHPLQDTIYFFTRTSPCPPSCRDRRPFLPSLPTIPFRPYRPYRVRERHNPVKSTRKDDSDGGEHEDGWDVALAQFQTKLHDIIRSGQPPGGLSPEMALAARIAKSVKEVLNDQ